MKEAFEINGLKLSRDGRRVLDIEHAAIPEGRVTVIVGPNGCGKTTLLECLNGLQRPDEGEVLYFGGALNTEAARGMTLVSQRTYLFDGTVGWNVSYGLRARGRRDCGDAVASALHAVRLDGFENRNAEKLSGGEAKRVAVARALALNPKTLLLDEPTADIDSENTSVIEDAVAALRADHGVTVVIATHTMEQASRLADDMFIIHDSNLLPYHAENHYRAILTGEGETKELLIEDKIRATATTSRPPGPVTCLIPPEDIIISSEPFESSARNRWRAAVTAVSLENGRVKVLFDADGVPVTSTITLASYEKLHPGIGDAFFLTFKASSVKVYR